MPTMTGLGELSRGDAEWTSAPVPVPILDGFAVPFLIACDDEDDPYAQPDYLQAVEKFMAFGERERSAATERVHSNYRSSLDGPHAEPLPIASPADIWRFVQPQCVRVDCDAYSGRIGGARKIYVVIECECDWDPEHGLQLVFLGGEQLIRVGMQDGHYTDD